jgi:hypothetical protein
MRERVWTIMREERLTVDGREVVLVIFEEFDVDG